MPKQIKAIFLILLIAIPLSNLTAQNIVVPQKQIAILAAIDFGSGAVKMQVGMVDIKNNRIFNTLLEKHISLNLTEDVASHEGCISEEMQKRALTILKQLKEEAEAAARILGKSESHPLQFSGIATAVFRKAPNGAEVLNTFEKQFGIRFHILSQDEEGKLGFMTAKALYPETPKEDLIAWDSGNGSFQMTAKRGDTCDIYQGPSGYGTVRVLLSKEIRQGPVFLPHESGNPVSQAEARVLADKIRALLPAVPDWLKSRLVSGKAVVVTFGDVKSLFPVIAESLAAVNGQVGPIEQAVITREDLHNMCALFLEQGDELFDAMGIYNRSS